MPSVELEALRRSVEATKKLRLRAPRPLDELDEIEAQEATRRSEQGNGAGAQND